MLATIMLVWLLPAYLIARWAERRGRNFQRF